MSTVGFLLYSISILTLRPKCHVLLRSSPVRAMRIAMLVLIVGLVLLPLLNNASLTHSSASNASNVGNTHTGLGSGSTDDESYIDRHYPTHMIFHSHEKHVHLSLSSILTTKQWYSIPFYIGLGLLFSVPPSCSVLGLVVPSVIIAALGR